MMEKGMLVRFIGATDQQVKWGNNDDPRCLLAIDRTYEVFKVEIHSWHTKLELLGFPNHRFNSVCFEVVE